VDKGGGVDFSQFCANVFYGRPLIRKTLNLKFTKCLWRWKCNVRQKAVFDAKSNSMKCGNNIHAIVICLLVEVP